MKPTQVCRSHTLILQFLNRLREAKVNPNSFPSSSTLFNGQDNSLDTSIVESPLRKLLPTPTPKNFIQSMLREPKYYGELIDMKLIDHFCVFCNRDVISEGLIDETEHFVALYNIRPVFPGHSLIIPKEHVTRFSSLPPLHAQEFLEFTQRVILALKSIHRTDSIELLIQEGPHSGQSISHMHLHLLPRTRNDIPHGDQAVQLEGQEEEEDWMEFFARNEHTARLLNKDERKKLAQQVRERIKAVSSSTLN